MEIISPSRAKLETNELFGIIMSSNYEKLGIINPYNMRDIGQEPVFYIDMISLDAEVEYIRRVYARDVYDDSFWTAKSVSTIVTPWFPFFANCRGHGRRVLFYDIVENGEGCLLKTKEETEVVNPIPTSGMDPVADQCHSSIKCIYEEPLQTRVANKNRWYEITEDQVLFYMTQKPFDPVNLVQTPSDDSKDSQFSQEVEVNSDDLIPASFTPMGTPDDGFPTTVQITILYYQVSSTTKRIVSVKGKLSDYQASLKDSAKPEYTLDIIFRAMNYLELVNAFQFEYPIYILLFAIVAVATIFGVILFWSLNILLARPINPPIINFKHMIEVTFLPPIYVYIYIYIYSIDW